MDRFVVGDRAPSSPERAKMLACAHPALDRPMKKGGKLLQDFDAELVATVIRFGTLCDGMRVGENSDLSFGCRKERCQFLQARVRFFRRGVSNI